MSLFVKAVLYSREKTGNTMATQNVIRKKIMGVNHMNKLATMSQLGELKYRKYDTHCEYICNYLFLHVLKKNTPTQKNTYYSARGN